MISVLVFVVLAVVGVAVILGVRVADGLAWQRGLVAHRLWFPRGIEPDQVAAWLASLEPSPRGLGGPRAIVLEIVATAAGIEHLLLVPERRAQAVTAQRWLLCRGSGTSEWLLLNWKRQRMAASYVYPARYFPWRLSGWKRPVVRCWPACSL